jgi:hypothetical protein
MTHKKQAKVSLKEQEGVIAQPSYSNTRKVSPRSKKVLLPSLATK